MESTVLGQFRIFHSAQMAHTAPILLHRLPVLPQEGAAVQAHRMLKRLVILRLVLAATFALTVATAPDPSFAARSKFKTARIGAPFPNITIYKGSSKRGKTLKSFRGKPVFVSLWAHWCGPCKTELPHIQSLMENLKGKSSLKFVLLSQKKDWKKDRAYLAKKGFSIPAYRLNGDFSDKVFSKAFYGGGTVGVPRTFLIDEKGILRNITKGAAKWDEKEAMLRGLFPKSYRTSPTRRATGTGGGQTFGKEAKTAKQSASTRPRKSGVPKSPASNLLVRSTPERSGLPESAEGRGNKEVVVEIQKRLTFLAETMTDPARFKAALGNDHMRGKVRNAISFLHTNAHTLESTEARKTVLKVARTAKYMLDTFQPKGSGVARSN